MRRKRCRSCGVGIAAHRRDRQGNPRCNVPACPLVPARYRWYFDGDAGDGTPARLLWGPPPTYWETDVAVIYPLSPTFTAADFAAVDEIVWRSDPPLLKPRRATRGSAT